MIFCKLQCSDFNHVKWHNNSDNLEVLDYQNFSEPDSSLFRYHIAIGVCKDIDNGTNQTGSYMIECIDKDTATFTRYSDNDCIVPTSNLAIEDFLNLEVNVEGLQYDVTCCTGNTCPYILAPDTPPLVAGACFGGEDQPLSLKFTNCTINGDVSLETYLNGTCSGDPVSNSSFSGAECGEAIDTCYVYI